MDGATNQNINFDQLEEDRPDEGVFRSPFYRPSLSRRLLTAYKPANPAPMMTASRIISWGFSFEFEVDDIG